MPNIDPYGPTVICPACECGMLADTACVNCGHIDNDATCTCDHCLMQEDETEDYDA